MKRILFVLFLSIFFGSIVRSQDSVRQIVKDMLPEFGGVVKTKIEYDIEHSLYRFEVRNARFSLKDDLNDIFGYKLEIDLSDEGKIVMLDAYAKIELFKNFELSLGQRKVPFGTDYMRSPADNFFANRSFVAKYVNNGWRDIGAIANYKTEIFVPVELFAAVLNGTGNNNPQWVEKPDFAGRIVLGEKTGFRLAFNWLSAEKDNEKDLIMYGGELRFATKKFLIETEMLDRNWEDTLNVNFHENGMYIHSYYSFDARKGKLKYIMPTIRWDVMGENIIQGKSSAERLTAGINLGFAQKHFESEIRLNYEEYFKSNTIYHTDKITIELLVKF